MMLTLGFSQAHNIGNDANIGIRGFYTWKQKKSSDKMLPLVGIEPRPLMNLWFQVQHYPFWANWTFACKTETSSSLCSHALLISTPSPKIKWCMSRSLKIPLVVHAHLAQKGEYWIWNRRFMRGPGFILTGFFCFHVVHLMPILALLPILSSLWKNSIVNIANFVWWRKKETSWLKLRCSRIAAVEDNYGHSV